MVKMIGKQVVQYINCVSINESNIRLLYKYFKAIDSLNFIYEKHKNTRKAEIQG